MLAESISVRNSWRVRDILSADKTFRVTSKRLHQESTLTVTQFVNDQTLEQKLMQSVQHRFGILRVATATGLLVLGQIQGQADPGEKNLVIQGIAAPVQQQAALLNVVVNQPERVYEVGETFEVQVTSRVKGFLYLFYVHSDDSVNVLFPNAFEKQNAVNPNITCMIPGAGLFQIAAQPPVGKGTFKAIVTQNPVGMLEANQIPAGQPMLTLNMEQTEFLRDAAAKGAGIRQRVPANVAVPISILADFSVPITTIEKGQLGLGKRVQRPRMRFVLAVGVGEQLDEQLEDLPACERDAKEFARLMETHYNASEVVLLTNAEATRTNVEKHFKALAARALPDDELILFWSGHGDRIPDRTGLETDGLEEILVLYDTDLSTEDSKRATAVSDDQIGRWLQDFNHCEVLVFFDTCFSGGQAENEKSLLQSDPNHPGNFAKSVPTNRRLNGSSDAWENAFKTFTKDISERQAMVISSSRASEQSYVRRQNDYSVMTYFLLQYMRDNAGKRFRPETLFNTVSKDANDYMMQTWGLDQFPVQIGRNTSGIVF